MNRYAGRGAARAGQDAGPGDLRRGRESGVAGVGARRAYVDSAGDGFFGVLAAQALDRVVHMVAEQAVGACRGGGADRLA